MARTSEPLELNDPRVMRALAHPLRLALLEELAREGPLTATQAAELLDDSPGNMSWHLRTLARYGFVEEHTEGAAGRARPWRLVSIGRQFSGDGENDPESELAAAKIAEIQHDRVLDSFRQHLHTQFALPPAWRQAGFSSHILAYLTADELSRLGQEMTDLIVRYRERSMDLANRPAGARPVHLVALGYPLPPHRSGN